MTRLIVGSLLAALACLPSPASASLSVAKTVDELIDASSAVVLAQAVEANARWEDGRIITYTRLVVEDTIAGDPMNNVWVRTLGGTVDGVGQVAIGEAALALGQRHLAFVAPTAARGVCRIAGGAQGVYHVRINGTRLEVASRTRGLKLIERKGPAATPAVRELEGAFDRAAALVVHHWRGRRAK